METRRTILVMASVLCTAGTQEPSANPQSESPPWSPPAAAQHISARTILPTGTDRVTAVAECNVQEDGRTTDCRIVRTSVALDSQQSASILTAVEGGSLQLREGQVRPTHWTLTMNFDRDPMEWVVGPRATLADLSPGMEVNVRYRFIIRCVADFDGWLRNCNVVEQSPEGEAAASSAIRIAERSRVTPAEQPISDGMRTFSFSLDLTRTP